MIVADQARAEETWWHTSWIVTAIVNAHVWDPSDAIEPRDVHPLMRTTEQLDDLPPLLDREQRRALLKKAYGIRE